MLYLALSLCYWMAFYLPLPEALQPVLTLMDFAPRWLVFLPMPLMLLPWFRPKRLLIPLLITLANFFLVLDLQLNLWPQPSPASPVYRFATFNAGGSEANLTAMLDWYQEQQLDALLLQEVKGAELRLLLPASMQLSCYGQLCLLSQHAFTPIRQLNRELLTGYGHFAAHYEIVVAGVSFQLVNLHLNTPRHGLQALKAPRTNYHYFMRLHRDRALESMIASQLVEAGETRVIIGGDFNLTQQSSIYRQQWRYWENSFQQAGIGFGYSKKTRLLGARIDHLLTSKDIQVLSSALHPAMGSDHNPLLVQLTLK